MHAACVCTRVCACSALRKYFHALCVYICPHMRICVLCAGERCDLVACCAWLESKASRLALRCDTIQFAIANHIVLYRRTERLVPGFSSGPRFQFWTRSSSSTKSAALCWARKLGEPAYRHCFRSHRIADNARKRNHKVSKLNQQRGTEDQFGQKSLWSSVRHDTIFDRKSHRIARKIRVTGHRFQFWTSPSMIKRKLSQPNLPNHGELGNSATRLQVLFSTTFGQKQCQEAESPSFQTQPIWKISLIQHSRWLSSHEILGTFTRYYLDIVVSKATKKEPLKKSWVRKHLNILVSRSCLDILKSISPKKFKLVYSVNAKRLRKTIKEIERLFHVIANSTTAY